jgi:multicomponent Na+:H+ antiporter subunit B
MKSLILQISVKVLFPLIIIASVLSLFRGHHEPGGGFIGGLVAASAFTLLTLAMGSDKTEKGMRIKPLMLMTLGLLVAFLSAALPLFFGYGFFEGLWLEFYLPVIGRPGTPLLFDVGVYLVVLGVISKIVFTISD